MDNQVPVYNLVSGDLHTMGIAGKSYMQLHTLDVR